MTHVLYGRIDVLCPPFLQLKSNERGVSLAKTLSNMGLYNMDSITDETLAEAATVLTPHSNSAQTLKVTVPPFLLLRNEMYMVSLAPGI